MRSCIVYGENKKERSFRIRSKKEKYEYDGLAKVAKENGLQLKEV